MQRERERKRGEGNYSGCNEGDKVTYYQRTHNERKKPTDQHARQSKSLIRIIRGERGLRRSIERGFGGGEGGG